MHNDQLFFRVLRAALPVNAGYDPDFGLALGFFHAHRETAPNQSSPRHHGKAEYASQHYKMKVSVQDQPEAQWVCHQRKESQQGAAQKCSEEVAAILNRHVTGPDSKAELNNPQHGGWIKGLQVRPDGFYCEV